MSSIKKMLLNDDNSFLITVLKTDGGHHLIRLNPGDDVAFILELNNADLVRMGNEPMSADMVDHIASETTRVWTPEVIAAYNSQR